MIHQKKIRTINDFEVLVLATMSAGKSTLINALLGQELLPAANQATTARTFRIEAHDDSDFEARLLSEDNDKHTEWRPATAETLKALNNSPEQGQIEMRGVIPAIRNVDVRLVIYDTPGPNNSQDEKHAETARKIMRDENHGLVIYVLNATQLGTNDDVTLLHELRDLHHNQEHSHKKVIFVINKSDQLDEEKGEDLKDTTMQAKHYLEKNGFKQPTIIPISAQAALLARKSLSEAQLTRKESYALNNYSEIFDKNPSYFLDSSILPNELEHNRFVLNEQQQSESKNQQDTTPSNSQLKKVIHASGIPLIETILEQTIKDHNFIKINIFLIKKKISISINGEKLNQNHPLGKLIQENNFLLAIHYLFPMLYAYFGNNRHFTINFNGVPLRLKNLKKKWILQKKSLE